MLEVVTFTGVDAKTDPERLLDLHRRYDGRLEFAVLIGTRTGSPGNPLYPSLDFVDRFRLWGSAHGVPTAIHLCGRYARSVAAERPDPSLLRIVDGFGRVQLNLLPAHRYSFAREIARFAESVPRLILQHHGDDWSGLPVRDRENVEYLWDRSGGRGRVSFEDWPAPPLAPAFSARRYGYAGGIGPDSAHTVATILVARPDARTWVDMEGRIRTNGLFDVDKVELVAGVLRGVMAPLGT